jgi:hypothetical protein
MKSSITGLKKGSLPKMYHPVPAIGSNLFGSNFTIFSLCFFTIFSPSFPHLFLVPYYDPASSIWHRTGAARRASVRAAL